MNQNLSLSAESSQTSGGHFTIACFNIPSAARYCDWISCFMFIHSPHVVAIALLFFARSNPLFFRRLLRRLGLDTPRQTRGYSTSGSSQRHIVKQKHASSMMRTTSVSRYHLNSVFRLHSVADYHQPLL